MAQTKNNKSSAAKKDTIRIKRSQQKLADRLHELRKKVKKIRLHQKGMRRDGKRQHADHVTLARHLRNLERKTGDWINQIEGVRNREQELESGLEAASRQLGILDERVTGYEAQGLPGARESVDLAGRTASLESLTQQIASRTGTLEQQIHEARESFDRLLDEARVRVGALGAAVEAESEAGVTAMASRTSSEGPSNIVTFKKAEGYGAGNEQEDERAAADRLVTRLDMLEDAGADLEEQQRRFQRALEDLQAGLEQADAEAGDLGRRSAKDREDVSLLRQELAARMQGLDAAIEGLGSRVDELAAAQASQVEELRQQGAQIAAVGEVQGKLDALVAEGRSLGESSVAQDGLARGLEGRLGELAAAQASQAEALRKQGDQVDAIGEAQRELGALVADGRSLGESSLAQDELVRGLEGRLGELAAAQARQAEDLREQGARIATIGEAQGKLDALEADSGSLRESLVAQAELVRGLDSRVGELTSAQESQAEGMRKQDARIDAIGKVQDERIAEDRSVSETLGGKIADLGESNAALTQRISEHDESAALLERRTHALQAGMQLQTMRYNRTFGGVAAVGLFLIALIVAAFWTAEKRLEQQIDFAVGKIADLGQEGQQADARLTAQETRLAGVENALVRTEALVDRVSSREQSPGASGVASPGREDAGEGVRNRLAELQQVVARSQEVSAKNQGEIAELGRGQQELTGEIGRLKQLVAALGERRRVRSAAGLRAGSGEAADLLGRDWLEARDPGHYTLQLVAAYGRSVVFRVADALEAPGPKATYTGSHMDRDWHMLLYGDFATLSAALEALAELPPEIQAFGPWPRSFREVHRSLAASQ